MKFLRTATASHSALCPRTPALQLLYGRVTTHNDDGGGHHNSGDGPSTKAPLSFWIDKFEIEPFHQRGRMYLCTTAEQL
eukprot:gene8652-1318_t